MFKMFAQLFQMFTSMFSAGTRLANAMDHSAAFVEGEAAAFNERAALERASAMRKLRSTATKEDYQFMAEEALAKRSYDQTMDEISKGHMPAGVKDATAPSTETVQ